MADSSLVPIDDDRQTFDFQGNPIRVDPDEKGNPRFVALDVCKAIGIQNSSSALDALPDDEKGVGEIYTLGGWQKVAVVTESGLYRLIFRSNKPNAEQFRKWVFEEVLPAIRKTGQYATRKMTPLQQLQAFVASLTQHQEKIEEHDTRILSLEGRVGKPEWYTILGYCRLRKIPPPTEQSARAMGKKAATLSRERGIEIGDADDARWATVHTYHISILDELFGGKQ